MVNAWSLLYDELYEDNEMSKKEEDTISFGDYSPVSVASSVVTAATEKDWKDFWKNDNLKFNDSSSVGAGDTSNVSADTLEVIGISGGEGSDTLSFGYDAFGGAGDYYPADHPSQQFWAEDGVSLTGNPGGFCQDTINLNSVGVFRGSSKVAGSRVPGGMCEDRISFKSSDDPYPTVSSVDSAYQFSYPPKTSPPTPSLDKHGVFKYNEDKSLKDARSYVMSTYSGHYTTKGSNTQTLDLIESVGDAESFCRSNALKYLSRYDKKGTPKNDILKAMHYCLLLYYFSGQTNEIETRGYETF